jgi:hypothetical protein
MDKTALPFTLQRSGQSEAPRIQGRWMLKLKVVSDGIRYVDFVAIITDSCRFEG